MDIKTILEGKYSKEQVLELRDYIGADTTRFDELLQLFLHSEPRITQRASWALMHCADKQPQLMIPHLDILLQNLRREGLHPSIKRNTIRAIERIDLPEDLLGEAADICFTFLADINETVAVRAFSMGVIWNICQKEPDLRHELRLLIEEFMPYGTSGFKSRGRKILKAMQTTFGDENGM